jgi:glycosyltransferase involved in cell wall biosynthesis
MNILLFHGYLLRGTGSNVYNAELARALVGQGHRVQVVAQERHPEQLEWLDGVHATLHRPDIGRLLPVYVADRYDGFDARTFLEISDEEVEEYVARNVEAVREVAERERPDIALANHLVMGPVILARALGPLGIPYAVKIHGSALEYTVKRAPERFGPYAREGLAGARGILVGSRHTAESLWSFMADPELPRRTRLGPPGVDVQAFGPAEPGEARARLRRLADRLGTVAASTPPRKDTGSVFDRDLDAASRALARLADADPLVTYVGKLIVSKGVDLLAAAWPLVLQRVPDATLGVIGFGAYREGFERLVDALATGDLGAVRALAEAGREAEGGPRAPLRHLLAFLDGLDGERRDAYLRAAATLPERLVVVGRLEHDELADVLPACAAQVVPSTFPEAFGMVAAEAAACGALPVSAAHSGLAEVSDQLAETVPPEARPWLSFPVDAGAVPAIADRLVAWLQADPALRARTREALVATARERFSWEGVARGVIAAAEGRLDELHSPAG